jgi:hypothetical protein
MGYKDDGAWGPVPENRRPRRTFRQVLRDFLNKDLRVERSTAVATVNVHMDPFSKSFEGWTIRLHRANNGHIVEAWKNDDKPQPHSSYNRPEHELFMVRDDENMSERLNDILVQLALRS